MSEPDDVYTISSPVINGTLLSNPRIEYWFDPESYPLKWLLIVVDGVKATEE